MGYRARRNPIRDVILSMGAKALGRTADEWLFGRKSPEEVEKENFALLLQGKEPTATSDSRVTKFLGGLFGGENAEGSKAKTLRLPTSSDASTNLGDEQGDLEEGDIGAYARAIKQIESSGNYGALGEIQKNGDRAWGGYQVMGANVGPWTEKYLGRSMSPEEFLRDQKAQDKVFARRFSEYAKKYGPKDAAAIWFSGRPLSESAALKDSTGTTTQAYVDKFIENLGQDPSRKYAEKLSDIYGIADRMRAAGISDQRVESYIKSRKSELTDYLQKSVADDVYLEPADRDAILSGAGIDVSQNQQMELARERLGLDRAKNEAALKADAEQMELARERLGLDRGKNEAALKADAEQMELARERLGLDRAKNEAALKADAEQMALARERLGLDRAKNEAALKAASALSAEDKKLALKIPAIEAYVSASPTINRLKPLIDRYDKEGVSSLLGNTVEQLSLLTGLAKLQLPTEAVMQSDVTNMLNPNMLVHGQNMVETALKMLQDGRGNTLTEKQIGDVINLAKTITGALKENAYASWADLVKKDARYDDLKLYIPGAVKSAERGGSGPEDGKRVPIRMRE